MRYRTIEAAKTAQDKFHMNYSDFDYHYEIEDDGFAFMVACYNSRRVFLTYV